MFQNSVMSDGRFTVKITRDFAVYLHISFNNDLIVFSDFALAELIRKICCCTLVVRDDHQTRSKSVETVNNKCFLVRRSLNPAIYCAMISVF